MGKAEHASTDAAQEIINKLDKGGINKVPDGVLFPTAKYGETKERHSSGEVAFVPLVTLLKR